MLLQYWSLVWFIWSTSARGFNNSVCSEFRACVFIKILFCSKGFSMTQITGSFCNCVLPTPLRGCHIFIYKDLFTIFSPLDRNSSILFYRKNFISQCFNIIGSNIFRSISQKCIFHLKSSNTTALAINSIQVKGMFNNPFTLLLIKVFQNPDVSRRTTPGYYCPYTIQRNPMRLILGLFKKNI